MGLTQIEEERETESLDEKLDKKQKRRKSSAKNKSQMDPWPLGAPDTSERDSLDGNLPGSSQGTGNPPPVPPPSTMGVSRNEDGPNSKVKKSKKLKNETSPPSYPTEDESKKKQVLEGKIKSKAKEIESIGYNVKTEPYSYMWVVLSKLYGTLVVILMLVFCLTEVLTNKVPLFTFQGVFLVYLYVGSIVAIMCIYVTVIIDNCPSITTSKENLTKSGDPEYGSVSSFGTLKRAHISRSKTSRSSFYLRVGALVFGIGSLVFNGLEIAMHTTMNEDCIRDVIFAHPILQALFTFLQMHFLFVNSEVIVERFGQIARFGFMHLVATNIALWIRMIIWESAYDWMKEKSESVKHGSEPKIQYVSGFGHNSWEFDRLRNCYRNNSLGELWINSQEYLFPFMVQYSLIAAAVTYIMWCNVGKEHIERLSGLARKAVENGGTLDRHLRKGRWKVDCRSASKGLFSGLLVLVGGTVILIIFFVMKGQEEFKHNIIWMCNGTQMTILSISIVATMIGFIQIPKLSVSSRQPLDLDRLLMSTTIIGVYLFAIFGLIVGGLEYRNPGKLATFGTCILLLIQVSLQAMLVAEASRRTCTSRYQMLTKPGRQVITFLLFSNITLWALDTFMTHNPITQQLQIQFFDKLVWGIISRISLPLMILFRFHSAVILVEIWKNTYRTRTE